MENKGEKITRGLGNDKEEGLWGFPGIQKTVQAENRDVKEGS